MQTHPTEVRRALGCGYEPHDESAKPWHPTGAGTRLGFGGELGTAALNDGSYKLEHCPGYTTTLPAVIDVVRARAHWSNGELQSYCDDERPSEQLVGGIEILDGSVSRMDRWTHTDEDEGGGRVKTRRGDS